MSTTKASLSKAGIKKLSNGDSVIPSSTRADGSVRKEIRVKPGYKPPEDVEVYKNRTAEGWRNRGKAGVPGADTSSDVSLPLSAAALKNAKRKEARKRAAAASGETDDHAEDVIEDEGKVVVSTEEKEVDKAKEARKLAKKLRQARELQDKKDQGEGLLPEQLSKVIKINELIRQLDALGFDANGDEKADTTSNPD